VIKVFIGYDAKESIAYHVLSHSLLSRSSVPISITPIVKSQLANVYRRPRLNLESTDFSLTRFLVPMLSNYQGWSLYMDCDMLCRTDIAELAKQAGMINWDKAVMVVKHDHKPKELSKFNGNTQTTYEKKNWSSLMLFNNERCQALTPQYIDTATGLELHQFKWLGDDSMIGTLKPEWNHLVGYDQYSIGAKIVHFTEGIPAYSQYKDCDYSEEWFREYEAMATCRSANDEIIIAANQQSQMHRSLNA
jgi:hypothetical protein